MTSAQAYPLETWQEVLARQEGVLSRRQALTGGLTRDQWRARLESGRWQSALPGVAVAHSGGLSEVQLAWAAVLSCGSSAALTADAALRLQGVQLPVPDVWHVATGPGHVVAPRTGDLGPGRLLRVQPHRVVALAGVVHPARHPRVLRPAAAVVHAAAFARSDRAAEWRVAAAVQSRVVTPSQVRDALQVLRRTSRRALVRDVLDDVELGAHARSELDLLAFLRRHRLPLPDRLQLPVRSGTRLRYLDAWWERRRVALEMDGAHHRSVRAWESDLLRANDLAVAARHDRALLLRLTPGHLRHDGAAVAAQLGAVLL